MKRINRKLWIIVGVGTAVVVAAGLFFFSLGGLKEEPLSAQERWQITDFNFTEKYDDYTTHITLKYLGENSVKNVGISTLSAFSPISSSYWHRIQYLSSLSKGDSATIEVSGYTFSLSISWDLWDHGDLLMLKAKFDVFPFDRSQLSVPPAED